MSASNTSSNKNIINEMNKKTPSHFKMLILRKTCKHFIIYSNNIFLKLIYAITLFIHVCRFSLSTSPTSSKVPRKNGGKTLAKVLKLQIIKKLFFKCSNRRRIIGNTTILLSAHQQFLTYFNCSFIGFPKLGLKKFLPATLGERLGIAFGFYI